MVFFDGHLDLAYLAVSGRDMLAPLDASAGPHPPAACTLPSLVQGGVRFALATIFTEPDGTGPEGYRSGDAERAFIVGRAQLEVYLTWQERGVEGVGGAPVHLDLAKRLRDSADLSETRAGMGVSSSAPLSLTARLARLPRSPALTLGILIENADPIRSPDDLSFWVDRGVCAIGLAWAKSSRYAGGNSSTDGLSDLGRALVKEMDRLHVVHDASHLSDRAFFELLNATDRVIVASHSNCRAIVDPSGTNQRHLTDEQIRHIARRGGVVGLNLYSKFLSSACAEGGGGRATIDDCVRHIEHIAEVAESVSPLGSGRKHVALGSDLDGGFPASRLPEGIDTPRDYAKLAAALRTRGWTAAEADHFACGNWLRVMGG